jgi:enamine deaminase RidA (YjgF/YER057c/UK114 family)
MTTDKETRNFGIPAERSYGYAQAVRSGRTIYISGQSASTDEGTVDGVGDMADQMGRAYAKIGRVLEMFGATMDDVVEETLFVTDITAAVSAAADVRRRVYGSEIAVASTLCGIAALGAPELLIEIKCVARLAGVPLGERAET